MQMSEKEIVRNYREAKEPGKQITVLAELNCCSKEDIFNVLKSNGVDINRRVFNGGNHKNPMKTSVSNVKPEAPKAEPEKEAVQEKPEENAAPEIEPVPEPEVVPASVIELVENEIHNLHKINNDLLKRVQENIATLRELEGFLDSHKADE